MLTTCISVSEHFVCEAFPATPANIWTSCKVKGGVGIDTAFCDLMQRHADHEDVSCLPVEELASSLRKAKFDLEAQVKKLPAWLPSVRPKPSIDLIWQISQRLLTLIQTVSQHMSCISKLDTPEQKKKTAEKRHWRSERGNISNTLHENHKIDESVAKVAGVVLCATVVPASDVGIKFRYQDGSLDGEPTWQEPFIVPAEKRFRRRDL